MVEVAAGPFGNSEKVWIFVLVLTMYKYWHFVANS